MSRDEDELEARVERWVADDPDEETREELRALLSRGDLDALRDRFRGPLRFGTAGLRGKLGAGPHRMNRAVVIRSVAGLCAHLLAKVPDARSRGVCIGYDARHKSRAMAEDAAAVVRGAGLRAYLFDRPTPTPVVAFSTLDRGAAAGLVVTASHNPPEYNGLKVYGPNGAQIVPPTDREIAEAIARSPAIAAIARPTLDPADEGFVALREPEVDRYLAAIARLSRPGPGGEGLRIAYTALHGVGEAIARRALAQAGFTDVTSVEAQRSPDPDFPTVEFPNPEERSALEAVLRLADEIAADLVLANDPDADRLAVAARHGGSLRVLSGNEVGCLLGHYLLERDGGGPSALVLSTFVSSPMLGDIARAHGATWATTLTGHKWIHDEAIRREKAGMRFVFGYEEALGYAPGNVVRDKDGISSAVLVAEAARELRAKGRTLVDELEAMGARYGRYISAQRAETYDGAAGEATIAARMDRARANPPRALGGSRVVATTDFQEGVRVREGHEPEPLTIERSNVLLFELEGGHRAMLRPSGTEPKLKLYVDVRVAAGAGGAEEAPGLAQRILDELTALLDGA